MGQGEELVRAIASLASTATTEFAREDLLVALCEASGAALGVDGVGVMLVDVTGAHHALTRFVHATPGVRAPEEVQEATQTGPCRDAIDTGKSVIVDDIRTMAERWGEFAVHCQQATMRAVVAVPLCSRGRVWGALDLYRREPGPWSSDDITAAMLLADIAVSYLVMAHDRDQISAAHRELKRQSLHDSLTGLPNRNLLYDRIQHALARASRTHTTIAVAFIDLDRFKDVNDVFGHASGDAVLVELANRISATIRTGDTLARLAGDEMVLLWEGFPSHTDQQLEFLRAVTSRLRDVIAEPIPIQGAEVTMTASIGVALVTPQPWTTAEGILHVADTAMYESKAGGRDRVTIHHQE